MLRLRFLIMLSIFTLSACSGPYIRNDVITFDDTVKTTNASLQLVQQSYTNLANIDFYLTFNKSGGPAPQRTIISSQTDRPEDTGSADEREQPATGGMEYPDLKKMRISAQEGYCKEGIQEQLRIYRECAGYWLVNHDGIESPACLAVSSKAIGLGSKSFVLQNFPLFNVPFYKKEGKGACVVSAEIETVQEQKPPEEADALQDAEPSTEEKARLTKIELSATKNAGQTEIPRPPQDTDATESTQHAVSSAGNSSDPFSQQALYASNQIVSFTNILRTIANSLSGSELNSSINSAAYNLKATVGARADSGEEAAKDFVTIDSLSGLGRVVAQVCLSSKIDSTIEEVLNCPVTSEGDWCCVEEEGERPGDLLAENAGSIGSFTIVWLYEIDAYLELLYTSEITCYQDVVKRITSGCDRRKIDYYNNSLLLLEARDLLYEINLPYLYSHMSVALQDLAVISRSPKDPHKDTRKRLAVYSTVAARTLVSSQKLHDIVSSLTFASREEK